MANEMMRIAGRGDDGTAKAIKTDANGNVGMVFVNSEVAVPVDLQYNNMDDGNALPVKQIRNQGSTTAHARSVIVANTSFFYTNVPAHAIGANIKMIIHGITGATFAAGQGVSLQTTLHIPNNNYSLAEMTVSRSQSPFPQVCMFHPSASFGDLKAYGQSASPVYIKCSSVSLTHMRLGVRILLDGTFETGKGVDCEAVIDWLY